MIEGKESKPSVCIIGSGRLGTALAISLTSSHYIILALVARRLSSAKRAAELLDGPLLSLSARQLERLPASDLVLITTPDDAIIDTAKQLASTQRKKTRGRTVLHTSGALSSQALSPLAQAGFNVGSIHPLVSISDPRAGANALFGAFYCIEGDPQANRLARGLVRDLRGHSFKVNSSNKPLYHAAAVMSSGHLVALFDLATEMLIRSGLSRKQARRALLPLLESTTRNLSDSDPADALTGTFARGDLATTAKHLRALAAADLPDALEVYKLLGHHSLKLAAKKGVKQEALRRIAKLLESQKFTLK